MAKVSRLELLRARLAAREGRKEYAENVKAIKAEIARLEDRQSDGE